MSFHGKTDLDSELNSEQRPAVTHGEGAQLVLAGAGSGKTRVITHRVAWLVKEVGIDPSAIVAVTFTNKAAGEMRERIEQLLGLRPLPTFVGTFHRFSLVLLRRWGERVGLRPGFAIFDSDDQLALIKKALADEHMAESSFRPRAVLGTISAAKNRLLGPAEYEAGASNFFERKVAQVYRAYQQALVKSSAVDFDDMLRLSVKLLDKNPDLLERMRDRVHYLLVDEFQDTNHTQMRLIHQIIGESGNLTAVGDEDQGIYRWRGADLDNVLEFERYFPGATVRKLERNYRSTQNILSASGALVAHNERRREKQLWTDVGDGAPIELYRARDDQDEARWVVSSLDQLRDEYPLSEMGILVRTNAQTRAFEEALIRREIPYVLVGGTRFYERSEIKDLIAYLRVIRNPRDNYSLLRILNRPRRGIGKSTQQQLEAKAAEYGGSLWETMRQADFGSLAGRSANALRQFKDMLLGLSEVSEEAPLPALLDRLLDETGYAKQYEKDDPDSQARRENISEFLTAAQEFTEEVVARGDNDELTAFLDHVALIGDIDSWESSRGVSLMTLHAAKGLEFAVVVVGGLEDGVLPHFNASDTQDDLEEERRLLYVGMTRAKERLMLTTCRRRRVAGRYQDQRESPFVAEIPAEALEISQSPELFANHRTAGVYTFFDRDVSSIPTLSPEVVASSGGAVQRGSRVRHPTLGEGVVMEVEGSVTTGKLTVYFDLVGKRRLAAKYANLELL
ncbi:MAG: UvrD-helicase domain-containing protein [Acidobacteria bacterium]|nr:UvrD-helicase domain-containing protein [Acidobacteriota bacterium]